MNVLHMTDQVETSYARAERRSAAYFSILHKQVLEHSFIPVLTDDIHQWKKKHLPHRSLLSLFSRKKKRPDSKDYERTIQWLDYMGKLDDYLDRSVSYIYMRDLGKSLDSPATRSRISSVVADVKRHLKASTRQNVSQSDALSLGWIYRRAQKLGIESAVIWLIDKLKQVGMNLPKELNAEHAERKLLKIILGVLIHVFEEMEPDISYEERAQKLSEAIHLGYAYGLTYPFIDDLLDSSALNEQEKQQYSAMIREALLTRKVPPLGKLGNTGLQWIRYVHAELSEAFEYMKNYQAQDTVETFFEQSYVFFQSQEIDRAKDLGCSTYTNEELYIPVIIKSSSSRLIVRSVIGAPLDEAFDHRTFYYGIYNQLADDFADMFEDLENGAVTPYTYYLTYHEERPDLINPFECYWAVISHLIHHIHHSDATTREVILDRAINGLKRCKERLGAKKYEEVMALFTSRMTPFNQFVQLMVQKADDVDFFDKLLRDQLIQVLRSDRAGKNEFIAKVNGLRAEINNILPIEKESGIAPMKEPLIDAANYSLEGDGKRIRPIVSWIMGVEEYGLEAHRIYPLLRSIEYMHTASLIFDDLPSQDNASTRRGRPTLHEVHNIATAELTGLLLIQRAIKEQSSLHDFDPKVVLALMQYSAEKTEEMCMGQAMDIRAKGQQLTLEELNMVCFYKTGIAFEASLIMPAILAQVPDSELDALKKYAYHAGIAFQIKDDLLDKEGDMHTLGKPVGQDEENNNANFVSILGQDGARKAMWEHYCLAVEALEGLPRPVSFLSHLLDFFVNRNR